MVKNAWFLTEIQHPDGDKIYIKYANCDFNYQLSEDQAFNSFNEDADYFDPPVATSLDPNPTYEPVCNRFPAPFSICDYYIHNYGLYPVQISSNSRGVVKLNYTSRVDLQGDFKLSSIEIGDITLDNKYTLLNTIDPNKIIKTFSFTYWDGAGSSRLFLTDIVESKEFPDDQPNQFYHFKYNNLAQTPERLVNGQDYQGYFNGKTNATLIDKPIEKKWADKFVSFGFADRRPDWNYSKVGVLSKVEYPSGGYDEIECEPNTVYDDNFDATPNDNLTFNEEGYTGTLSHKLVTKYSTEIHINQNNIAHLTMYCKLNSSVPQSFVPTDTASYYLEVDVVNSSGNSVLTNGSRHVQLFTQIDEDLRVMAGQSYKIKITYSSQVADIGSINYYSGPKITEREVCGVRTKKIISNDNLGHNYVKRYYYTPITDTLHSDGLSTMAFPDNKILYENHTPWHATIGYSICTYIRFSSSYYYGGNSGPHILYPIVLESNGDGFNNGIIEHKFFTAFDNPAQYVSGSAIMNNAASNTSILSFNNFEYETNFYKNNLGSQFLQKSIARTFKNDYSLLKDYNMFTISPAGTGAVIAHISSPNGSSIFEYTNVSCLRYEFLKRWFYPDKTITKEFDEKGNILQTTEMYEYVNAAHKNLTKQTTIYDNQNIVTKEFKYVPDVLNAGSQLYNQIGAIYDDWNGWNDLNARHIIDRPIHTITHRNNKLLEEFVNFYRVNPANSVAHLHCVYSHIAAYPFEKKITIPLYNEWGQVLTQQKNNDAAHSYLWDYKNLYPIAEAVNASSADLAYTSFEADGKGNWQYSQASVVSTGGVTGMSAFVFGSADHITRGGLTSAKTYIVSYWSNGSAANVNGTTAKVITTRNGWTLYSHFLTATPAVDISGAGLTIDELRLYPKEALLKTYTYFPLTGMSTATDANNRSTYYEYDDLQRLKLVRDDNQNILKTFDYKYQTHPNEKALWELTGSIRCKPCALNPSYHTNIQQHEENDIGLGSATFGNTLWVDDGTSVMCAANAVWQNTSRPVYCQTTALSNNTGRQVQEQEDINPCSTTFGSRREHVTGYSLTTCPLTVCSSSDQKLVNFDCETGTKVLVSSHQDIHGWHCTYHYLWSDGTTSPDYTEITTENCMLQ